MLLYLVRHGEAKTEEEDAKRGLSDHGAHEVNKIAVWLEPQAFHVHAVWHSGKERAKQTAEILAASLNVETGVVAHSGLNPNDSIFPIREAVNAIEQDLMIVGHLPFLGKLTSALIQSREQGEIARFEPGTIVCLEQGIYREWWIRWMIVPKLLPDSFVRNHLHGRVTG